MNGGTEPLHSGSDRHGTTGARYPKRHAEVSTETVFETLSSCRRRYALHHLAEVGEPATLRELSEQIAAWENGIERADVTPKQRKRVYTALHQTHLPKMDALGVVEYDRDRKTVTLTDAVTEFDVYLDVAAKDDLPWSQFYLGLGSVLTGLVAVAALGLEPFSWLGGFGYALVVSLAFTAVAAYHTVRDRRRRVGSETNAGTSDLCSPPGELGDATRSNAGEAGADD